MALQYQPQHIFIFLGVTLEGPQVILFVDTSLSAYEQGHIKDPQMFVSILHFLHTRPDLPNSKSYKLLQQNVFISPMTRLQKHMASGPAVTTCSVLPVLL